MLIARIIQQSSKVITMGSMFDLLGRWLTGREKRWRPFLRATFFFISYIWVQVINERLTSQNKALIGHTWLPFQLLCSSSGEKKLESLFFKEILSFLTLRISRQKEREMASFYRACADNPIWDDVWVVFSFIQRTQEPTTTTHKKAKYLLPPRLQIKSTIRLWRRIKNRRRLIR